MNLLHEYRCLEAEICAAATRALDASLQDERDKAFIEFEGLLLRESALLNIMTSMLGVYVRSHLPTSGPLHERLMVLPVSARRAYQAQTRFEVAEEDFHVHLLSWADSCDSSLNQIAMDRESVEEKSEEGRVVPAIQTRR